MSKQRKSFFILMLLSIIIIFVHVDGFLSVDALSDNSKISIYYKGNEIRNENAYSINGGIFLPCSMIGKYIRSSRITVDEFNKQIVIDIANANLILEDVEVTEFIKQNMDYAYIPLRNIEGQLYFPLDVLKSFFHVTYSLDKNRVYIEEEAENLKAMARINKESVVVKPSVTDKRSKDLVLNSNDIFQIIYETENYYKVRTQSDVICFLRKSDVDIFNIDLSQVDFYNFKREKMDYGREKINLVWEYVYLNTPAPDEDKNDAIDIISPTWFYIKDSEGNVGNKADKGYLNQVHQAGYKVWGLATNSFNGELTHTVLNNEKLTKKVVAQFLFYASLYNLDGLNIDFESVKNEDRDALTNFVSMMRYYTEKQGLTLSIDVMVPAPWNMEYDRKALSHLVDYIAVMTYDEHWSGSTISGSVASYDWVNDYIKKSLQDIPSEKLLIGIPLYTRLWIEEPDGNGGVTVSSQSLSMEQVREIIKEKGLRVNWLDKEKQHYIEYYEEGKTYKVWIEDSRSIAYKLSLIEAYDLGGSASWRKGFEEESVWDVFEDIIKKGISFKEYRDISY